ncbi:uncharacterized protein [Cardiocondyla obscurior]|uniref:uncharacterized protein isoform X2 n=1 Tax=Cardiocondyla obscurior TaxID=286306 RepID=UPI0039657921
MSGHRRRRMRSRAPKLPCGPRVISTYYMGNNEVTPPPCEYLPPSAEISMQPRDVNKRAKNKKRREAPQERSHPWNIGTLKGHTGLVNDMNFSSNGRYLASCADDENLRETRKHVQSYESHICKTRESKKKASSSLQADREGSQSFPRREDKAGERSSRSKNRGSSLFSVQHNMVSEEASSLEVFSSDTSSNDDIPDESQHQSMYHSDVSTSMLSVVNNYTLTPQEMFDRGYPFEPAVFPGYVMINNVLYPTNPKTESDSGQYSNSSSSDNSEQESSSDNEKNFDAGNDLDGVKRSSETENRSENKKRYDSESSSDNEKSSENEKSCDSESGFDSEKSSKNKKSCDRKSCSKDKSSSEDEITLDEEIDVGACAILERTCVRCKKIFYADRNGEYLNEEPCIYHSGKLYNRNTNDSWYYTCCNQGRSSRGCTEWKMHVWTGLVPGMNGPLPGYVHTVPSPVFLSDGDYGIYAMDCEMCYTLQGLELAKVTVVNLYGQIVYDTLVKPSSKILDYNTKFSGITEEMMIAVTKTLPEVQRDLLKFVHAETILMGHDLGNDFRALRMVHKNVVDTSALFPHHYGLPYRIGLKTLARTVLNRRIQEKTHSSIEDAQVVVDIVLRKVQYDWHQQQQSLA